MNNEVKEKIEKVNRAMSQEGMPLTEEDKKNIKEVITGKVSVEQKVKEVIELTNKINESEKKRK